MVLVLVLGRRCDCGDQAATVRLACTWGLTFLRPGDKTLTALNIISASGPKDRSGQG